MNHRLGVTLWAEHMEKSFVVAQTSNDFDIHIHIPGIALGARHGFLNLTDNGFEVLKIHYAAFKSIFNDSCFRSVNPVDFN
jgi:hypothetical protein